MSGRGARGIAASFLCHGDGETPPLRDGAVVLDGEDRIAALGERATLERKYASVAFERHDAVVMPGLVNAHTHLELSALRGQVPGGRGFVPWVDALVTARARVQPEIDAEAIDAAVSELLAFGVVAVGEVTNHFAAVDSLGAAPLLGRVFHEVFGVRRDTGAAMLAMARQERAARASWPRNLAYALAPHTPYTLHPDVIRDILAEVRRSGGRTSLHLAEHAAERAFLMTGQGPFSEWLRVRAATPVDWSPPGTNSIAHSEALGALAPDVIAVHLTDARPEELARVANAQSPVVLCPRSNLYIELKLPPLLDMLRAGIRPGLGTDSLASNASLDPLAEARALHQRFPTVAPRVLLAMATGFGADALGFSALVGRLRVGSAPGLIAFAHGPNIPIDPERFVLQNDKVARTVLSRPWYPALATEVFA